MTDFGSQTFERKEEELDPDLKINACNLSRILLFVYLHDSRDFSREKRWNRSRTGHGRCF